MTLEKLQSQKNHAQFRPSGIKIGQIFALQEADASRNTNQGSAAGILLDKCLLEFHSLMGKDFESEVSQTLPRIRLASLFLRYRYNSTSNLMGRNNVRSRADGKRAVPVPH